MHISSGCKDNITPITKKTTHLFLNYTTFYEFMINFLLKNVGEWTSVFPEDPNQGREDLGEQKSHPQSRLGQELRRDE